MYRNTIPQAPATYPRRIQAARRERAIERLQATRRRRLETTTLLIVTAMLLASMVVPTIVTSGGGVLQRSPNSIAEASRTTPQAR